MIKEDQSNSWFIGIKQLLSKYELDDPLVILSNPLSKTRWKNLIKNRVKSHYFGKLIEESSDKSSLKYLYIENDYHQASIHNIYQIIKSDQLASRKVCIKAKLICGVYMLQSHKVRYCQSDSRVCPLCNIGNEDAVHFILYCNHSDKIEYYKKKNF